MIHSLKLIEGSIQGINNAVRKLSDNLCDLSKKITELSELGGVKTKEDDMKKRQNNKGIE